MLDTDTINKLKESKRLHSELKSSLSAVSVIFEPHYEGNVHLGEKVFLDMFNDYEVKNRGGYDFPYSLVAEIEGITFFAMCKELPEAEKEIAEREELARLRAKYEEAV